MLTKGKWSWAYGRMEARIKIPRGQGIWPAFWMLGANIDSAHWPTCGEIDIMENIGKTSDQGTDHGTIHGPQGGGDYNGGSGVGGSYTLPGGAALADAFHIYAIEWTPNQIKWFLDSTQFFTATPASLPGGSTWVFTQPQFFILNVAVGGNWPGFPDGTTVFPQQMIVDYVRVYQQTLPLAITVTPQPDGSLSLSWPNNIVCHLQAQTNSIAGGSWSDLPVTTSPYIVTPDPTQTAVFYRLASP
jgi:beta-glucanase (GH16 family)